MTREEEAKKHYDGLGLDILELYTWATGEWEADKDKFLVEYNDLLNGFHNLHQDGELIDWTDELEDW